MGFIRRHVLPLSLALFALGFGLLYIVPDFPAYPYLVDQGLQRVFLSIACCGMIAFLGGYTILRPTLVGMRSALRGGAYPVYVSLVLCAIELVAILGLALSEDSTTIISSHWLLNILEALFLCVGVGLFEEALCRGVLFCGLLSKTGSSKDGVLVAAVVSSIAFGAIHVLPIQGRLDDLLLMQMLLKTVQAGLVGLLLASTFVRTHSLYGVALLHCLTDFFLFVPEVIVADSAMTTSYVTTGGGIEAIMTIVSYCIAVAMYLPACFKSFRLLDGVEWPDYGCFVQDWEPREIVDEDAIGLPPVPDGVMRAATMPPAPATPSIDASMDFQQNKNISSPAPKGFVPRYPEGWTPRQ